MQRVAILVDGWNLLKAADRVKQRVNLAELARAVPINHCVVFQRLFLSGENMLRAISWIFDNEWGRVGVKGHQAQGFAISNRLLT